MKHKITLRRAMQYCIYKYPFLTRWLSDKAYLQLMYWVCIGKKLNLKAPRAFNEKMQWLKLYNRNPDYPAMADKYAAKELIRKRIGEEYVPRTYAVWDSAEEIDFDILPDRFVLKCTHDCGGMVICHDKSKLDQGKAREKIALALKRDYYYSGREWPYSKIVPKVIAEEFLEDRKTGELRDYTFFTFSGVPKLLFVASERQAKNTETKFDFFDMDYEHLELVNGHPNAGNPPEKPENFELMKELAAKLSEGTPHLRVDFYEANGRVYVGELTFFHWSGFVPFEPESWDLQMGDWLELPKEARE